VTALSDTPEQVARDLREIAQASAPEGVKAEEMQEWRAAQMIETATKSLREIRDGAPEPRAIATVALMELGDGIDEQT
jgi:hypothetical protein